MKVIKVGTRRSQLALKQTQQVLSRLECLFPQVEFELVPYMTKGDRLVKESLQKIGGKGVFVKDIEQALLDGRIDLAVHSLKDVPAKIAEGCVLAAIPKREDVRDSLIFREKGTTLETLKEEARVGTSSLRRQVQLAQMRPDLMFLPLRGNIDTRLQRLFEGEYDAIVLAQAGLNRLGWQEKSDHVLKLDTEFCLPAISQGALALECRAEDLELQALLAAVHDEETAHCAGLERRILSLMGADCSFPLAALAKKGIDGMYHLEVMVADEEGQCKRASLAGTIDQNLPEEVLSLLNF